MHTAFRRYQRVRHLIAIVAAAVIGIASLPVHSGTGAEQDITRTIRVRLDAASRGDATTWSRYVDDQCLCGGERKADILRAMEQRLPGVRIHYGDMTDVEARVFGDTAVYRYRLVESVEVDGQLSKSAHWRTETYVRRARRWMLIAGAETPIPPDPEIAVVVPEVLAGYVGRYEYTPGAVDIVTLENGQLYVEPTDEPKRALFPENANTFFAKGQPWRLVFRTGADGIATSLVFRQPGQEFVARRLPDPDGPAAPIE
jgi:hypothetical protein